MKYRIKRTRIRKVEARKAEEKKKKEEEAKRNLIRPLFYVSKDIWREFRRAAHRMDQKPSELLPFLIRKWLEDRGKNR